MTSNVPKPVPVGAAPFVVPGNAVAWSGARPASKPRRARGKPEDDFQRRVIDTAKLCGWMVTHFRAVRLPSGRYATAIQGDAGFPDLVLARDGVVLLVELKSDRGSLSTEQRKWLAAIGAQGRVWRPKDWDAVLAELSAPRPV